MAVSFVGCAGALENPAAFLDAGLPHGTGGCADVQQTLFATTCESAGCHGANDRAGSLDLQSPGLAARLVHQPSNTCTAQTLVTGADAGFFFAKLSTRPTPPCGSTMPLGGTPLTQPQIDCISAWLVQQSDGGL